MYRKFKLNLDELKELKDKDTNNWTKLVKLGEKQLQKTKESVENDLNEFTNADGSLQADKIIKNWFPSINADIFISHSHKDEDLVLGLAGWLYENFRLTAFIDSVVWGYSDKLLRQIDNKYCRNKNSNSYNYQMRNRSTTHVHMMLSTALMDMIDKCEMFLFIETDNSFKPSTYYESNGETESPWIYSELSLVAKIRENIPDRHKSKSVAISEASTESMRINYTVNTSELTALTRDDLINWKKERRAGWLLLRKKNLDTLYNLTGV